MDLWVSSGQGISEPDCQLRDRGSSPHQGRIFWDFWYTGNPN